MGDVVWDGCSTRWNPKRNDCYANFLAVISTGGAFKAVKRHGLYEFEVLDSFSTKDEASKCLSLTFLSNIEAAYAALPNPVRNIAAKHLLLA